MTLPARVTVIVPPQKMVLVTCLDEFFKQLCYVEVVRQLAATMLEALTVSQVLTRSPAAPVGLQVLGLILYLSVLGMPAETVMFDDSISLDSELWLHPCPTC